MDKYGIDRIRDIRARGKGTGTFVKEFSMTALSSCIEYSLKIADQEQINARKRSGALFLPQDEDDKAMALANARRLSLSQRRDLKKRVDALMTTYQDMSSSGRGQSAQLLATKQKIDRMLDKLNEKSSCTIL